jgi:hypothetical protein
MYTHPAIAAALAAQQHRDRIAEARSAELARAARAGDDGSTRRTARWLARRPQPGTPAVRRGLARLLPARAR